MADIDANIRKVLDGDLESYAVVVRAYEAKVRVVIAAMVPDSSLVDDLTLEVFVIAYQRLSNYEPGTRFDSWLRAIARNVAQNERRRWYRRRDMKERYRAEAGRVIEDKINRIVDSLHGDVLDALRHCVRYLEEKSRALVESFYFKEQTVKELARGYNMPEGSVRVALYRARQAIAECMRKKGAIKRKTTDHGQPARNAEHSDAGGQTTDKRVD